MTFLDADPAHRIETRLAAMDPDKRKDIEAALTAGVIALERAVQECDTLENLLRIIRFGAEITSSLDDREAMRMSAHLLECLAAPVSEDHS